MSACKVAVCVRCGKTSSALRPGRTPQPECADCRRRAPRVPERVVQQQCVHLLRSLGGLVWVLGTTRRQGDYRGTMQTPGLPDVVFALKGRMGMLECKAAGGRLRPEQETFRQACQDCGVHHVVGGVDELVAWLVGQGLVRADHVPHYRLPGAGSAKSPRLAVQQPRRATQPLRRGAIDPEPPSGAARRSVSQSLGRGQP